MMTAKEMVIEYLKTNGYDGLAGDECGCEISDLMPCGEFGYDCYGGYKITMGNKLCNDCEYKSECGGWCIRVEGE